MNTITFLQKIGASYTPDSSEFIVWAPLHNKVRLKLTAPFSAVYPMQKEENGYWKITFPAGSPGAPPPGARYLFQLDEEETGLPDPASFSQPEGVHAPSELIDRFGIPWTDKGWQGIPLSNKIIYELHTGAFSPSHDFNGVIEKLDHLVYLGINTIELMPLAQFPGDRNWGYDGVYPFAVQSSYGGAAGLQALVNAAHNKGLSVIVDVVYNHFGPEGNYLENFAPYFTDEYKTPWGKAINFAGPWSDGVRNFFLQNARMWLEDYHVDVLRLDAVHAIRDHSAVHFVQQLKELALDIERRTGCRKELIAEIDLNDPRYINPASKGGYGLDGQWIDEFHHALRSLLTGETNAYYEDFGSIQHLEKAFRNTYVYDGVYSKHRQCTFGGRADSNNYDQFIVFAQNHDQIGNRAVGDRLTDHLDLEQLKLAAATVLLSPYVPLLFMGEEYGERNPFPFFGSFGDAELVEAIRNGRAAEFKGFAGDVAIPDPMAPETFASATLSWKTEEQPGVTLLSFYRHLIGLRKSRPALQGRTRDSMIVHPATGLTLPFERKILNDQLFIWLHFGPEPVSLDNITGRYLAKVFDSADVLWGGPGASARGELAPGQPMDIKPHSVVIYESK
jgi:maltooligosyltrehalose trehalohydrolase